MVNIEPYQYQKVTNIKEHNDIVSKINEIVDVVNNTNLDIVGPKISELESEVSAIQTTDAIQTSDIETLKSEQSTMVNDISVIKSTDSLQWTDIENLKDSQSSQDVTIHELDTQIKGITESLVTYISVIDGTTTGKFKVRLDRKKAPSIDSNDYDLQKATSIELIQGSGPSMLKAQITLSDGTILRSDDFLFTTEAIGTDVYISSFVFKNGNVDGTISADIGLSNGSTLEANNFVVPMDPSLLSTVQDLSTRLSAVENGTEDLESLKAQVQTNTTNISTLNTEIDNLDIKKADQSNSNQEIVAGRITATNITKGGVNVATTNDIPDISGKVDVAQGVSNAGKVLGIGSDGNVTPTEISSSGFEVYTGDLADLFEITTTSFVTKKDIIVRLTRGTFSSGTWSPSTAMAFFFFPKSGKEWLSSGTGRGSITQSNLMLYNGFKKYVCDLDSDGTISAYSCDISSSTWSESNISYAKNDTIDNRLNTEKIPNGDGSGFTTGSGGYITLYTVYVK